MKSFEACQTTAPAVNLALITKYVALRVAYACAKLVNRRVAFAVYDALYAVERAVMA